MNEDLLLQYKIFLAIAPVTIVFLALLSAMIFYARRTSPAAPSLLGLLILVIGYILCNALEQVTTTQAGTIFFAKMTYLFLTAIPVVWVIFAVRYSGRDDQFRFRHLAWLFLIPAISDIGVFTNEWHGLIWRTVDYLQIGYLLTMRVEHGFWFYVATVYNYTLLVLGALIILRAFMRSPRIYRRQAAWLLAGVLCPLVFNITYILNLVPGLVKDYTCFGFFFSVICFYIGIFRYRLLELLPIARTMIIEQMREGVIIIDSDTTILDINPQAKTAIGQTDPLIGKPFAALASVCPELFSVCRDSIDQPQTAGTPVSSGSQAITLHDGADQKHFDIHCIPMIRKKRTVGHLITLHDSTEQVRLLRRIEQLALTDELTGLYNRRYFMETYHRELERCSRYQKALSMGVLDIDFFKKVNDVHGHPAGDRVLAQFGKSLREALREADIVARLGGEEFGVLMPETGEKEAYAVFCRLQELIARQVITVHDPSSSQEGKNITITVSIGVAGTENGNPSNVHRLFEKADQALYQSKNQGRNRVTLWKTEF